MVQGAAAAGLTRYTEIEASLDYVLKIFYLALPIAVVGCVLFFVLLFWSCGRCCGCCGCKPYRDVEVRARTWWESERGDARTAHMLADVLAQAFRDRGLHRPAHPVLHRPAGLWPRVGSGLVLVL